MSPTLIVTARTTSSAPAGPNWLSQCSSPGTAPNSGVETMNPITTDDRAISQRHPVLAEVSIPPILHHHADQTSTVRTALPGPNIRRSWFLIRRLFHVPAELKAHRG